MFNIKHGLSQKNDTLPDRILKKAHEGGGYQQPLEKGFRIMMEEYYKTKNWPKGIPSESKLRDLGLDFTIKDLKA